MPEGYAVRMALDGDLPRLPEIERAAAALFAPWGLHALFASVVSPEHVLREALARGHLVVAAHGGSAVGYAMLSRVDWHAHLDELHVVPEHGRRGLGGALLDRAIAIARAEALGRLTLATMRRIAFNAPWYLRRGFRELGERELGPGLRTMLRRELSGGMPVAERVVLGLELG